MKIIQIVFTGDEQIYGLGDDGRMYCWLPYINPSAYVTDGSSRRIYANEKMHREKVQSWLTEGKEVKFSDGQTAGWAPVSDEQGLSTPIINPLDPTRHERS